jgi:hypothetical protein
VSPSSAGFSQQSATFVDKVKEFIFISCFTQAHQRVGVLLLPEFYQWLELLRFE